MNMTKAHAQHYRAIINNNPDVSALYLWDEDDMTDHTWVCKYKDTRIMLMYMPNADITYIHSAYREDDNWHPGEVLGWFYGEPWTYDFATNILRDLRTF